MDDSKEILKYVLAGAIGLSIGALIGASFDIYYFGAIFCGLSLGIVSKNIINGIRLALGGFMGSVIGSKLVYIIYFFVPLGNSDNIIIIIIGMIWGAFYGISLLNIKKIIIFMIAGGVGTLFGSLINVDMHFIVSSYLIIGASFGTGMYFSEKEDEVLKIE